MCMSGRELFIEGCRSNETTQRSECIYSCIFFVLTSFHQYVQCPATEHHREYHDHQNPYQRWKNHKQNTPLSDEGLFQIKEYCFIIRYDMHYSDQSDIVFIYFLSITFHHPNLNYSLGNDTADFHAFPKIFLDLNGLWPKNFT